MATASSATPAPVPAPSAAANAKADAGLLPILVLAAAQFVMVLDSSVMNVSISQIVADLDTTVQGVQGAITFYTLVMAALMLLGAKLGDVLGRTRAFSIGLAIYGLGSLTTALSPNLTVLLIGWSTIEGIGAALVIPAIMALIVATYTGSAPRDRVRDRRRRGRRRDRHRPADRRLGDDRAVLALRVRRRGRRGHRRPDRAPPRPARHQARRTRRSSTWSAPRWPAAASPSRSSGSSRARPGAGSSRWRSRRSAATRSRRWASASSRS